MINEPSQREVLSVFKLHFYKDALRPHTRLHFVKETAHQVLEIPP